MERVRFMEKNRREQELQALNCLSLLGKGHKNKACKRVWEGAMEKAEQQTSDETCVTGVCTWGKKRPWWCLWIWEKVLWLIFCSSKVENLEPDGEPHCPALEKLKHQPYLEIREMRNTLTGKVKSFGQWMCPEVFRLSPTFTCFWH